MPARTACAALRFARGLFDTKFGFLVHACAYVIANVLLLGIDLSTASPPASSQLALSGWDLAIVVHGVLVHLPTDVAPIRRWLFDRDALRVHQCRQR